MGLPKKRPKYTHSYVSKGTLRHYVRYQGIKHDEHIQAPFGTPEFYYEHAQKLRELQERIEELGGVTEMLTKETSRVNSQTLEGLYKLYKQSTGTKTRNFTPWDCLRQSTQHTKSLRIERFLKEVFAIESNTHRKPMGKVKYRQIKRKHLEEIRQTKKDTPEAANTIMKDLSSIFQFAIIEGLAPEDFVNPCHGLGKLKPKDKFDENGDLMKEGYHTWTMEEVEQFKEHWPLGTMPRLALTLLLLTGARVSDAYRLGVKNEKGGLLEFIAQKTRKEIVIPILPELRDNIDACPSGNLIYLATSHGQPFKSSKGFSNWFVDRRADAGLPQKCVPHGLRKAGATFAAEGGATEAQLMAIYGWTDPEMARKYIESAEKRRLAMSAMHLLTGEQN